MTTASITPERMTELNAAMAATPQRVRTLRLHLGLSEAEMAGRAGLSLRAYRYLERRNRQRSHFMVFHSITMATGVSTDWVFTGCAGPPYSAAGRNDAVPLGIDRRPLPRKGPAGGEVAA